MNLIKCNNCNRDIPSDSNFCCYCGNLIRKLVKCSNPECNFIACPDKTFKYCPKCGRLLIENEVLADNICDTDIYTLSNNDFYMEKAFNGYLKEFGYKFVKGSVVFGWIYQIFKSVGSGKFIFSPEAFKTDIDELDSIDPGIIFSDEAHHWNKTGFFTNSAADRRFNTLIELLKSDETEPGDSQAVTLKERFLAHMYNAITIAQHFNE